MKKRSKIILAIGTTIITISLAVFSPILFGNRDLNEEEQKIANSIFDDQLNYEKIRINQGGPLTWIYPAVTIGYVISFPNESYDFNNTRDQALLLHELTHVWQYENIGWIYALRSLYEEISQKDAYVVHYNETKDFLDYDLEEQAEIVAEYFLHGTKEYEKYIESL
jgi:hypothetical protein